MEGDSMQTSDSAETEERGANATLADRARGWLRGASRQHWADYVYIAAFGVLVLIATLTAERFFTPLNISNLFRQIVTNGLISLGMLVVILTGGIDLSVGPIVALSGILFAGLTDEIGLVRMINEQRVGFGTHAPVDSGKNEQSDMDRECDITIMS